MDNLSTQTSVRPEVIFLTDILNEIAKGRLCVPRFQRPFVWKLDDMIDLFDSILKGYPIGSLLFWKTGTRRYATFPKVGPHIIPMSSQSPINYILDGHQRLSTLFGVLTGQDNDISEGDYTWNIYYNLRDKIFIHVKKQTDRKEYYISLKKLLRTVDFLNECKRIQQHLMGESSALIQEAEKLLDIIRNYRIAIIQIDGGDIESAVRIFSRLNTTGIRMADDRMYAALTYKEGQFNLSDSIDVIIEQLAAFHFHNIDRVIIFRIILAAAGKDIYTDSKLDLFENTPNLEEIVQSAERAILKTAHFMHNDLAIPSDNFLPYSLQFLNIAEFFRLCPEPESKLVQLRQWFWVTSFAGINNVNTSKKMATINEIRNFAEAENGSPFHFKVVDFNEKAIAFPNKYNLSSARTKAFTLFLSSLNPKKLDNSNEDLDVKKVLANNGYRAFNYILAKESDGRVANRIISNNNNEVKDFLNSIRAEKKVSDACTYNDFSHMCASHAITREAFQALIHNERDEFLLLREQELIRLEKEFLINVSVIPYDGNDIAETVNDSDSETF